ncbi:MAG TPA: aminotransferase class V-fold PLP-dependent enzyme [Sphingobacteriaceae bacterium]|nr:aminotransferase class V-fold PLP-dependent enzyme [Sphingobacteriaceae bacterium]
MKRREVIKGLTALPLAGTVIGSSWHSALASPTSSLQKSSKSIYTLLGVRPVINARGTVTIVGASRILPEVQQAMDDATKEYVQIDELMDKVGDRLAQLTGAEWGFVSAGASAAITAGTAGCVTGGDPDKAWQIPDLTGMKDEVIITSYSRSAYDTAAKAVGVRMVEVTTTDDLRAALGPRTAMILILAGSRSENGPLSLKEISSIAKPMGVPILVDAAAEGLEVPNPHLLQGADLVAYSGGKYLRGPQCAGLLIGRKDLIQASRITTAPHHGFGRGFKVGREEIVGMLTAVEMWFKRDHAQEWKVWMSGLNTISRRLEKIPGVKVSINEPQGRSNRSPSLNVQWDMEQISLTGQDVEQLLWDGNPRIAVGGAGSFLPFPPNLRPNISINISQLGSGEEKLIADRVYSVLANPPKIKRQGGAAAFDLTGQWDLEMKFAASTVDQTLMLEQKANELLGTHTAGFGARDLTGTLYGREIMIRSSYTRQGVRLNFEFTGTVSGDTMEGKVSMGEYGMAAWKAKRRTYRS